MVNTPIPHSLKSEAKKAAKILREFTIPSAKTGPDKLIPAGILARARGLAIITVFKAGFLVTARGGSGIVIAKVGDDSLDFSQGWSAPSAIGMAGLGGGFEIGAEVTDFVIILNTKSAVDAFSKGGNLTLGGNFTIAAGPLGRNIEGDIAVRSPAAIYTYSKTKGIFAGISVEGSALIERKDANRKFYGKEIRAFQILNGEIDPPDECQDLYAVIKDHQEFAVRAVADMAKHQAVKQKEKLEEKAVAESYSRYRFSNDRWRSKSTKSKLSSSSMSEKPSRSSSEWALTGDSTSTKPTSVRRKESWSGPSSTAQSTRSLNTESSSSHDPWSSFDKHKGAGTSARSPRQEDDDDDLWAVADFTFQGQLSCDLPFRAGDRIKVTTHTSTQQDWWEGIDSAGRQGIFPANFIHVVS